MTITSTQLACRSPLYDSPPTLLPENIAGLVTAASLATRISLRCSSLVVDALFEGAKCGTTFSLGLSRSAITTALMTAKRVHALSMSEGGNETDRGFVQLLDKYTNVGLHFVHSTFTLTELFALSGLQMTSQTIKSGLKAAEESVRVFDGIFGSNDTSRAIASFIDLIYRQLMQDPEFELAKSGKIATLAGLTKALTAFAVLQTVTHKRRMKQVKLTVLWQGLVVEEEENEQAVVQYQNIAEDDREYTEIADEVQKYLYQTTFNDEHENDKHSESLVPTTSHAAEPPESLYEISTFTTHTTTRTTRIQPIYPNKDRNQQPKAKYVTTNTNKKENTSYLATIDREPQKPTENSIERPSGFWQIKLSAISRMLSHKTIKREEKYGYDLPLEHSDHTDIPVSDDMIEGPITTMTSTSTTMRSTAAHYSHNHSQKASLDEESRHDMTSSSDIYQNRLNSFDKAVRPKLDRRRHSSASDQLPSTVCLYDGSTACPSPILHQARERSNSLASISSMTRTRTTTTYTTIPQPLSTLEEVKDTPPCINPDRLLRPKATPVEAGSVHNHFPRDHLVRNLARFVRYASAAYGESFMRILGIGDIPKMLPKSHHHHPNHHAFAHHTGVSVHDIILSSYTNYSPLQMHHPSSQALVHYVVVDHAAKAIVLACRGTLGISDVLTDLTCTYADFDLPTSEKTFRFTAHGGMLNAAQLLAQRKGKVYQAVCEGLSNYPDYGLVLCGHSLGGGVVSLLSVLWSEKGSVKGTFVTSATSGLPVNRPIHCFVYGPPCVMSPELSEYCGRGLVTSIVHGCDFVSGLSLGVLEDIKHIATSLHIEGNVVEEIISRAVGRHPKKTEEEDDDQWFWAMIKTLRADMRADKLYPPSTVYHIESVPQIAQHTDSTTTTPRSASHQLKHKKAHMMVLTRCDDVLARFSEITFSRSMFIDHSPSMYEKSLWQLHKGMFGQQE